MTLKEWNALKKITSGGKFSCELHHFGLHHFGRIALVSAYDKGVPIFVLEYPSYSVPLYRDKDISSTDRYYLRYLYNACMSVK